MSKNNAVVWFDLYVKDMRRAVVFYQTVLAVKLHEMDDPTGNSEMMSFPMNDKSMSQYGALGALVKMDGVTPSVGGTTIDSCAWPEVSIGKVDRKNKCQRLNSDSFGVGYVKSRPTNEMNLISALECEF